MFIAIPMGTVGIGWGNYGEINGVEPVSLRRNVAGVVGDELENLLPRCSVLALETKPYRWDYRGNPSPSHLRRCRTRLGGESCEAKARAGRSGATTFDGSNVEIRRRKKLAGSVLWGVKMNRSMQT